MEDNKNAVWIGLVLFACATVGGGIYWYYSRPASQEKPERQWPAHLTTQQAPTLPPLDLAQSDAMIRERAKNLGAGPRLAEWLKADNIIRRVTAAISIIAAGKSPRDSLSFLKPVMPFAVKKTDGKLYIDPRSYARYDPLADAFESLNAEETAKLFRELKPLFQQAYGELGESNRDIQEPLIAAIGVLLRTPIVQGDIQLKPKVLTYTMTDAKLEGLSPAQKHLLRMGPKNAAKIQAKLREIARALGVAEDHIL